MSERATVKAAGLDRPEDLGAVGGSSWPRCAASAPPTSFAEPLARDLKVRVLHVLRTFSPRFGNVQSLSESVVSVYVKTPNIRLTSGASAGSTQECHSTTYSRNMAEESGSLRTAFHTVGSLSKIGKREYATTAFLSL